MCVCRRVCVSVLLSNLNFSGTKRQTHDSVASVLWKNRFWLRCRVSSTFQSPISTRQSDVIVHFKVQSSFPSGFCSVFGLHRLLRDISSICLFAAAEQCLFTAVCFSFYYYLQEATLSERREWTQHWKSLTGHKQRAETHYEASQSQRIHPMILTLFNIRVILSLIWYEYKLKPFFLIEGCNRSALRLKAWKNHRDVKPNLKFPADRYSSLTVTEKWLRFHNDALKATTKTSSY